MVECVDGEWRKGEAKRSRPALKHIRTFGKVPQSTIDDPRIGRASFTGAF